MNSQAETIFIIDDEESIRQALSAYLESFGYHVEIFSSSEEFLARNTYTGIGCLVLDVNLNGKSGLELQEELFTDHSILPIIFISGLGNIQMSVRALKKGAVNFLEKPFSQEELLNSINEALSLSRQLKQQRDESQLAQQLISLLTSRELEVLRYSMSGLLNKQVASELNIAEQTVKHHRQSISEKLNVKSMPEMIRIAEKAGVRSFLEDEDQSHLQKYFSRPQNRE